MALKPRPIVVEQLERIPEGSSWDLPKDEVYVQLGCAGCANQVCLVAKGMTSEVPEFSRNPDDTQDFNDLTYEVEKRIAIHQGMASHWDRSFDFGRSCELPCPDRENIETVTELLNERFGSSLQLPVHNEGEQ